MFEFDLKHIPFSYPDSYLAFSYLEGKYPPGLYLRSVRGGPELGALCRLEILAAGEPGPGSATACPFCLKLEGNSGLVEFCFAAPQAIRLRGKGSGLRLVFMMKDYDCALPLGRDWQITCASQGIKLLLRSITGGMKADVVWGEFGCSRVVIDFLPENAGGLFEAAIEEFITSPSVSREDDLSFDDCLARNQVAFESFMERLPAVPAAYAKAREMAAYVLWSAVVKADGHLKRRAILMSKNWMTNVWSWDHCFNAMAVARGIPFLAWAQFMLPFEVQAADGALPDFINSRNIYWSFCKPPIHGWALAWMMRRSRFFYEKNRLVEVYEPLSKWTLWWLTCRDSDGDGIPEYHHGNDSGWDNATVFQVGSPVEGPDLSAYLVLQMETLAEMAEKLGRDGEAAQWKTQAVDLLRRLLEHSWRDGRFLAPRSGDHRTFDEGDSLLPFLPVILGPRLPEHVRSALVTGLKQEGRFLTPYGLATESLFSPYYHSDGYWRGPVWAPPTLLIVDGLRSMGEEELSREIARRFCDLVAKSGTAENFDALSGEGLRDRAYTWTASIFLILANEYLENGKKH